MSGTGIIPRHAVDAPRYYPREYERVRWLRGGRAIFVRPIVPGDAPALAEAIRSADPDTLYRRFLGGPPRLTPAILARLTTLDYRRRFALVAGDPQTGRGIGIARYEGLPEPGVAEVSVAVDPAWRRVGVAATLIEILAEAAIGRGVHTFRATYLAGNRPVAALLAKAGRPRGKTCQQGVAEVAVALSQDHPPSLICWPW